LTGAARAELHVITSTAPNLRSGTVLPDNARLRIPDGATVHILRKPQQRTYTLDGPFTGTLLEYLRRPKCGWLNRLIGNCPTIHDPAIGGTPGAVRGRPPESKPGGVRSMRPPPGGVRAYQPKPDGVAKTPAQ
jgi:hypothetical protein